MTIQEQLWGRARCSTQCIQFIVKMCPVDRQKQPFQAHHLTLSDLNPEHVNTLVFSHANQVLTIEFSLLCWFVVELANILNSVYLMILEIQIIIYQTSVDSLGMGATTDKTLTVDSSKTDYISASVVEPCCSHTRESLINHTANQAGQKS